MAAVPEVGDYLRNRIKDVGKKYPELIKDVRGLGTYLAFSSETTTMRDALMLRIKHHGINQNGCGATGARLRPTLYFEKKHADIYTDALEKACSDL